MRIAIIGAGFTGLAAGYYLAKAGQKVVIFEKESQTGGLSSGFKEKNWEWSAEKFYHHIFTNDMITINLSRLLGIEPIFSHPTTAVYWKNNIYPFNGAFDLLRFPGLNLIDKMRMGAVIAAFKIIPNGQFLESLNAQNSLNSLMGHRGFSTIWEPLLFGKFHQYASGVNLAWFWARIKKRTPSLGTFPGGFQALADRLSAEFVRLGGQISLNTLTAPKSLKSQFDVILSTSSDEPGFSNGKSAGTPEPRRIALCGCGRRPQHKVRYLWGHVLLLEMNKPFLKNIYWLNILDRSFPFLVTAEHTNFVDKKHFGNTHLLYIGNYLPPLHPLISLTPNQIFQKYLPYLKKINPGFSPKQIIKKYLFMAPDAQPVMAINYSKQIPKIKQDKKNYIANQSMIYPWDRGVNYAIELGQKAAREILK